MTNNISPSRFLFTESFAYKTPEKDKTSFIFREILNLIPIVSVLTEGRNLVKSIKNNSLYHEKAHEESKRIFDVRFSAYSITLHAVNTVGIGIIILPIRLIATYMRSNDLKEDKEFDNPHFLTGWQLMTCKNMNVNQDVSYNGFLNHCPDATDYAQRMAYRDHIKNPEYIYKSLSLYPDPLRKPEDKPFEDIITKNKKEYAEKISLKTRQYLRSIRRQKDNAEHQYKPELKCSQT